MKALAILCACLAFGAAPAYALGHSGPSFVSAGPGFHGGGFHGGGLPGGGTRGGFVSPFLGSVGGAVYPPAADVANTPAAPVIVGAPQTAISISAAPGCGPAAAPAPERPSGPHIIYIGHQPEIHGPKVIYGTD